MTFSPRFCHAAIISLSLTVGLGANAPATTIDGFFVNARVFNDMPGSTLTITPATPINTNPATITIDDQFTGSGANRHDVMVSSDGGTTPYVHDIDESFRFTTVLTLSDGSDSPRKEAGIRINSSVTGDMLFIVNSDAGEIVTFGGPFHSFGSNGGGNGYTPGTPILLGIEYLTAGDGAGGVANTTEYFIDYGAGIITTGPLPWTNVEGGPVDFQVGVYAQGQNNAAPGDFVNAMFTDTTYITIPEPGTFALVGMGALLGLLAKRRTERLHCS